MLLLAGSTSAKNNKLERRNQDYLASSLVSYCLDCRVNFLSVVFNSRPARTCQARQEQEMAHHAAA
jgi:hypothetical protein